MCRVLHILSILLTLTKCDSLTKEKIVQLNVWIPLLLLLGFLSHLLLFAFVRVCDEV